MVVRSWEKGHSSNWWKPGATERVGTFHVHYRGGWDAAIFSKNGNSQRAAKMQLLLDDFRCVGGVLICAPFIRHLMQRVDSFYAATAMSLHFCLPLAAKRGAYTCLGQCPPQLLL